MPARFFDVRIFQAQARLAICALLLLAVAHVSSLAQPFSDNDHFVAGDTFFAQQSLPLDPHVNLSDSLFDERLIGFWEHRKDNGTMTLEIVSDRVLLISGQTVEFEAAPGLLRINDKEYGAFDYPYTLKNDRLTVTFIDDTGKSYDVSFRRASEVKPSD